MTDRLYSLLKRVSRAFYLTIRVLPGGMREPVALAYLLARTADTIVDTQAVPSARRLALLLELKRRLTSEADPNLPRDLISALGQAQPTEDDRNLLDSFPETIRLLELLPPSDRHRVVGIVTRLTEGMEFDLRRFPEKSGGELLALDDDEELDRYTFLVAGCVGEFWTDVAMAHTSALRSWDAETMSGQAIRFGKGLQMVNVLRDLPADLRIGRCYVPRAWLDEVGLTAADLLDPSNSTSARPLLTRGAAITADHLAAAEDYVFATPRRCVRLRLAAVWPLLMGWGTLAELLRNQRWLDPASPARVSRGWVYRMIALSSVAVLSNSVLRVWIRSLRRHVVSS